MNCEAVDGGLVFAEPLCVNCEPPDGLPNIGFCDAAGAGGDLLNKLLVLENKLAGAEPIRLNSDGLLPLAGVVELTGRIGLPFISGVTVAPPEPEETLLLYFPDPSEPERDVDDPGAGVLLAVAESFASDFDANGFKLLSQPASAWDAAANSPRASRILLRVCTGLTAFLAA